MSEEMINRGRPGRPALQLPENILALLGKTSDAHIARIMKCSTTTIANLRKSKGIEKYTPAPGERNAAEETEPLEVLAEETQSPMIPASLRKAVKAAVPTAEGWCIPFREYSELLADLMIHG